MNPPCVCHVLLSPMLLICSLLPMKNLQMSSILARDSYLSKTLTLSTRNVGARFLANTALFECEHLDRTQWLPLKRDREGHVSHWMLARRF
jgi:hypothetical protein